LTLGTTFNIFLALSRTSEKESREPRIFSSPNLMEAEQGDEQASKQASRPNKPLLWFPPGKASLDTTVSHSWLFIIPSHVSHLPSPSLPSSLSTSSSSSSSLLSSHCFMSKNIQNPKAQPHPGPKSPCKFRHSIISSCPSLSYPRPIIPSRSPFIRFFPLSPSLFLCNISVFPSLHPLPHPPLPSRPPNIPSPVSNHSTVHTSRKP
jgi:hypothetical protein